MAPGLVTAEKAARGKLPTDTWWHTIVPTNGAEKTGYPTQKPEGVLRRIVQASSRPGGWCLDFFAGSGTLGAVCAAGPPLRARRLQSRRGGRDGQAAGGARPGTLRRFVSASGYGSLTRKCDARPEHVGRQRAERLDGALGELHAGEAALSTAS